MSIAYRTRIREIAERRRVPCLYHFTQITNLPGIVRHGLVSRRALAALGLPVRTSALYRLDQNDEAVSLSVSQSSREFFSMKRQRSGLMDWTLLALSPDILWTHECQFSWRNAATSKIRNRRWRGGPWSFEQMFQGTDGDRRGLEDYHPTDIESEVQVMEPIAPGHIMAAAVERPELVECVSLMLSGLPNETRPVFVMPF